MFKNRRDCIVFFPYALASERGEAFSSRSGDDALGELIQECSGIVPTQAGVGNGNAVRECDALFPGLFAGIEIAFQHQAHD